LSVRITSTPLLLDILLDVCYSDSMTTNQTIRIGSKVKLPDGPTVTVTAINEGIEYGDPVLYVTGINSLGQTVTRWIRR